MSEEESTTDVEEQREEVAESAKDFEVVFQRLKKLESEYARLTYTVAQIEDATDDEIVLEQLHGGVLREITPDRREEVKDRIEQQRFEVEKKYDEVLPVAKDLAKKFDDGREQLEELEEDL